MNSFQKSLVAIATVAACFSSPALAVPAPDSCPSLIPLAEWPSTQNPRAIAVLVHGITANSPCLQKIARALADDGVATYGLDIRGHGWWYSNLPVGAPGKTCNYNASVQDLDMVVRRLRNDHPGVPIFLIGESVGAAIALRTAADCPGIVDGAVLCASGNRCAPANPFWVISDLLKACVGRKIDLTRYQDKYGTEDKVAIDEMQHEPGVRTVFAAKELLRAVHFIHKNIQVARDVDPHLAVLVLQGEADRTIRPRSSRCLFAQLASLDKRYISIPHCGHILLATPRLKPMIARSIVEFINQRSSDQALAQSESAWQ